MDVMRAWKRRWILGTFVFSLTAVTAQAQNGVTLLPPVECVQSLPATPTATVASVDQLIAMVLTSDPKLRVGYEDINQAAADSITAALRPNPTFSTDTQLLPLTRPFTPAQQGGPPQFDAIVSYPIDWFLFGKRKAAIATAEIGVRQTEAEYYDLVRQRIRDASILYYDVLEAKALREVAQQDVDMLKTAEDITRRAVDVGGRPVADLNRIRIDLLQSRQMLLDAESKLKNAKTRMRALLGRVDSDAGFEVTGTFDPQAGPAPMTVDEAVAMAQENRPDLAALRYRVARAEATAALEQRKAYPAVAAKAGYTRQFQNSIGFRDADTYLVGFDVGLPFSDRNQGNRVKAASQLAQSQYQLQLNTVELRSEIEQALNDYDFALRSTQVIAKEQLKIAEELRASVIKAKDAGGQAVINVLDAQKDYRETFRLYVVSRANFMRASVRLNAALGKKFAQ